MKQIMPHGTASDDLNEDVQHENRHHETHHAQYRGNDVIKFKVRLRTDDQTRTAIRKNDRLEKQIVTHDQWKQPADDRHHDADHRQPRVQSHAPKHSVPAKPLVFRFNGRIATIVDVGAGCRLVKRWRNRIICIGWKHNGLVSRIFLLQSFAANINLQIINKILKT